MSRLLEAEPIGRRWILLLACFLLSGIAGLIYQTAWLQQLTLVFGASEIAVAAVLAAYMSGLALGALAARRYLDRLESPLLTYAVMELAIAVFAMLVPITISIATTLRQALFSTTELGQTSGPSSAVFYLICTFVALAPPTLLMGATLPILCRWAVRTDQQVGPRVAVLYAVNTAGAAAGALIGAFVLLPSLGLGRTIWVAVALNVLAGLAAVGLYRSSRKGPEGERTEGASLVDLELSEDGQSTRESRSHRWVLPAITVSGFVAFGWEVVWTRLLAFLLGGSIYSYGLMLATFLAGIALGSLLGSSLARSRSRAHNGFAWSQLGIGFGSWLAFVLVDNMASAISPSAMTPTSTGALICAAALLPGALLMGAAYPCAVRLLATDEDQAGGASARVYAWNTFGAIAGALVVGYNLLPHLRFAWTGTILVATSLVLGLVASHAAGRHALVPSALAIVGLLTLTTTPPHTPWQVLRTAPLSGRQLAGVVDYYGVGRSSTVMVHSDPAQRDLRLTTNGLPESVILAPGSRPGRVALAQWLSLLPVAARPEARSMLIVGLGSGLTISSVPRTVERIDVVELEPEVVSANRAVANSRASDPLSDPRLRVITDDARSALSLGRSEYDIIVSQPSHPWTAGAANLYTREFFTLVAERLGEDGVFVQWIGLRFVDSPLLKSLLATLLDAFPHVEAYSPAPGTALVLMASRRDLETSQAGFDAGQEHWSTLGAPDHRSVAMSSRLSTLSSREYSNGAPLTTDARNLLQLHSPNVVSGRSAAVDLLGELFAHDSLRHAMTGDEAVRIVRRLIELRQLRRARQLTTRIEDEQERRLAEALLLVANGQGAQARALLSDLGELGNPLSHCERLAAQLRLDRAQVVRLLAQELVDQAERCDSAFQVVLDGWRNLALQRYGRVLQLEDELAEVTPEHPLYIDAVRLRIGWRRSTASAEHHRDALTMVEELIAPSPRGWGLLAERALLATGAGATATLDDAIAELTRARPQAELLVRTAERLGRVRTDHGVGREETERAVHQLRQAAELDSQN